jgi:glycine oxidase
VSRGVLRASAHSRTFGACATSHRVHVLVVGAGAIGLTIASELAGRGANVTVFDSHATAAGSSGAAAGMLAAQLECLHIQRSPFFDLAIHASELQSRLSAFSAARALWARRAAEFRDRGVDVGYLRGGALEIATTDEQAASLAVVAATQSTFGERVEWVERPCRVHSLLSTAAVGALHFPDEAQVDPRKFTRALADALRGHERVRVRLHSKVIGLTSKAGLVAGVCLDNETVLGDAVVLATGVTRGAFPEGPRVLATLRPIRGQMLELEVPLLTRTSVLGGEGVYLVPRGDGRVVCGSTMEDVGLSETLDVSGQSRLVEAAHKLVPSITETSVRRAWFGFRPFLPRDGAAVGDLWQGATPLAQAAETPGLFLAAGHHRNGILLCYQTAQRIADLILGECVMQLNSEMKSQSQASSNADSETRS